MWRGLGSGTTIGKAVHDPKPLDNLNSHLRHTVVKLFTHSSSFDIPFSHNHMIHDQRSLVSTKKMFYFEAGAFPKCHIGCYRSYQGSVTTVLKHMTEQETSQKWIGEG